MNMDGIKLFAKNEKELEILIEAVRIYSRDIRTECRIEKSTMLLMKSGKPHIMEGVELPNQEVIRTFGEKETYKYLGILEADTIKKEELKEKNLKSISEESENHPKTLKMVLDTSFLNTQQYKVRIKGKLEQSREMNSAHSVFAIEKEPFEWLSITVTSFTFIPIEIRVAIMFLVVRYIR